MEYTYEVRKLSNAFYSQYPQSSCPEIERKSSRGYASLLVNVHEYIICIPFRSNINHEYAYLFKNSVRSKTHRSGLDYTKICIIDNLDFIDNVPGIVDTDEYVEMKANMDAIVNAALNYIDGYVKHHDGSKPCSKREYRKKYWFTTLKYFHNELGL